MKLVVGEERIEDLNAEMGIYAQDKWTLKRLTLNGGIWFDYLDFQNANFDLFENRPRVESLDV